MSAVVQLLFLVAVLAVFWLLMIRPAKRAQRNQQELISSLEVGDEVVINSGIFGRVASIDENTIGLEVAPGTTLKVATQVVVRRVVDEAAPEPGTAEPTTDVVEEN